MIVIIIFIVIVILTFIRPGKDDSDIVYKRPELH